MMDTWCLGKTDTHTHTHTANPYLHKRRQAAQTGNLKYKSPFLCPRLGEFSSNRGREERKGQKKNGKRVKECSCYVMPGGRYFLPLSTSASMRLLIVGHGKRPSLTSELPHTRWSHGPNISMLPPHRHIFQWSWHGPKQIRDNDRIRSRLAITIPGVDITLHHTS